MTDSSQPAISDVSADEEELALAFKTIGGALLLFDGLVSVFVPIGLRFGSFFWLYWVMAQGTIGLGLIGYALLLEHRAATRVGNVHRSWEE